MDKAVELKAVGGCNGGFGKPSHFLCLILKMLQVWRFFLRRRCGGDGGGDGGRRRATGCAR